MSTADPRADWERRLLDERARTLATPRTPRLVENTERVIVCALGDALFGVNVGAVLRATPFRRPARLPGAQAGLLGLSAQSGVHYRIYDLAALLLNTPGPDAGYFLLLRRSALGVRVDHALDIVDVAPLPDDEAAQIGPSHDAVRGYARTLQDGAAQGRLISLINLSKLFADALPPAHGGHPSVDL